MFQPRLTPVHKILPKYLPRIASQRDGENLLKVWLLDDLTLVSDSPLNPLQELLRSPAGRRWLHETTGNLVRVFLLDPLQAEESEPEAPQVHILSRRMPYTLAIHHIAELFGIQPQQLPALVFYLSLELESFCVLQLADVSGVSEVKSRLTATFEMLKDAARAVVGKERVDALLLSMQSPPLSLVEARRISEDLRQRTDRWPWSWHRGAQAMEKVVNQAAAIVGALNETTPDVVLEARYARREQQPYLQYRLEIWEQRYGPVYHEMEPWLLAREPGELFEEFFNSIENLSYESGPNGLEPRIEARGANLFKNLFPPELREILWSLVGRQKTFQILSNEPWIPWELVKLQGREGDPSLSGPFLTEAFALTRWVCGNHHEAPEALQLPLTRMGLTVVGDSGLPSALLERDFVLSLSDSLRRVTEIPADGSSLLSALGTGCYDGWHFVGHGDIAGGDPLRQGILLADGEWLRPVDLTAEASGLRRGKPIIFLNACSSARGGMQLAGPGGWAHQFLAEGAGAFLGPLWKVPDRQALAFAKAFYRRFVAGDPLGEAVRQARLEVRAPNDPTWLAYAVYGHPCAGISQGGDSRLGWSHSTEEQPLRGETT